MQIHEESLRKRRVLKRPLIVLSVLSGLAALIVTVVIVQSFETHALRSAARKIQVGDDIATVDTFLGGSTYGYEYGWPVAGAPPTKFGAMYGGSLNTLHEELNSFVSRLFSGTQWYNSSLSQHPKEWPVLVSYNSDGFVTAVFIDGTRITSEINQRTNR